MLANTYPQARILILDDQDANLRLLRNILIKANFTDIMTVSDPRELLDSYAVFQPDIILLDLMMPHITGFEIMELLRPRIAEDDCLPILVLTADASPSVKHRALSMGAHDFLTKPFDTVEVLLRVKNLLRTRFLHLQLVGRSQKFEDEVHTRTFELREAQLEVLERLAIAAEYRNDETGQHIRRVSTTAFMLADALGVPHSSPELIRRASQLHDVGKIGIPDDILLKPGKFTPAEFEVMKTHTTIGARILSGARSDIISMASAIAYTHHERWDGSGYPRGLSGDAIPIEGRIVAVADVFDALTNHRPYKEAWPVQEAINEIKRQSGSHFDPAVAEAFLELAQHNLPALIHQTETVALSISSRITNILALEASTQSLK